MQLQISRSTLMRMVGDIRRDPVSPFQTERAARELGTSTSNFIHAFKRATGVSPMRFRAALRIERAKRLLLSTRNPVTDICFEVGYTSVGTFTRTFSGMVGLTPSRFRELALSRPDGDLGGVSETDAYVSPEAEDDIVRVAVSIDNPRGAGDFIVAGLFEEAVPAGWPIHGRRQLGGARIDLFWPPGRSSVALMIAAFSRRAGASVWSPAQEDILVYACGLRRDRASGGVLEVDAPLRRLRDTDPPLVIALPLLMAAKANARRRREVTPEPYTAAAL